jgi:hypothetical protein
VLAAMTVTGLVDMFHGRIAETSAPSGSPRDGDGR